MRSKNRARIEIQAGAGEEKEYAERGKAQLARSGLRDALVELATIVSAPNGRSAAAAETLREATAPSRFGELDSPPSPETALWAFKNCLFMRNRFTVADLLFLLGWWNDDFIEGVFERASSVGGGL